MYLWFHKLGSPPHFYLIAGKWIPWLTALLLMALAFQVYYVLVLFEKCRAELLQRERNSRWVEEL